MRNMIQLRRSRLAAFAVPQAGMPRSTNPQLQIATLRDYRVREPVSGRSYTIIKLRLAVWKGEHSIPGIRRLS